jgi:ABC-type nickel/cobalt efflux system permease component RcnA
MLTPTVAAIILLVACIVLLIVIPMLDGSEKFNKFISLRYTLVALTLIMALGCILDFSHLSESSRNIVLMGGMILVGIFVLVRSLEKMKLGKKVIDISAEKNGVKVAAKIQNKEGEQKTIGKHIVCESCNSDSENKADEESSATDAYVECCDPDEDVKCD